jgi:hypothetical protein
VVETGRIRDIERNVADAGHGYEDYFEGQPAMLDRLVTVATFQDPVAAELARNFLASEGVSACLLDETTVATDWLLAGAIGGIKLQVEPMQVERAEMLLAQIEEEAEEPNEPPPAPTAIAAQEIAEDLAAEREDKAEINKLVDRIFRATVFGLLFPPLQLYAFCLLAQLTGTPGAVSPNRRWKVWASVLVCVPALSFFLMLFCCGQSSMMRLLQF